MSCLNYWEISDKVMSITLVNASNNGRAVELLVEYLYRKSPRVTKKP